MDGVNLSIPSLGFEAEKPELNPLGKAVKYTLDLYLDGDAAQKAGAVALMILGTLASLLTVVGTVFLIKEIVDYSSIRTQEKVEQAVKDSWYPHQMMARTGSTVGDMYTATKEHFAPQLHVAGSTASSIWSDYIAPTATWTADTVVDLTVVKPLQATRIALALGSLSLTVGGVATKKAWAWMASTRLGTMTGKVRDALRLAPLTDRFQRKFGLGKVAQIAMERPAAKQKV